VGQTFGSGRLRIDGERALAFAAEFDPQPFHLDEAARHSIFGGMTASGWHTAAVTMRLLIETELQPAGGIVGAGLDECRWPRPVRPGDELRVECEVLEVRPSKSRPEQGLIKLRTTTLNQDDEAVLGACLESGRAAPEGHSAGATVGKLQGKAAVIAGSTTRIGFAAATFSSRAVARRSLTRPQKPLVTMSLASRETSLSWLTLIGSTRPSMRNGGECHR
jgi:acyl dehydratase